MFHINFNNFSNLIKNFFPYFFTQIKDKFLFKYSILDLNKDLNTFRFFNFNSKY
jgi:hypothetical protein